MVPLRKSGRAKRQNSVSELPKKKTEKRTEFDQDVLNEGGRDVVECVRLHPFPQVVWDEEQRCFGNQSCGSVVVDES